MRSVKINECLLTADFMGVGTSVHRRCSLELLVPVQRGERVVLTSPSTESYGFYAYIDCKHNNCVLSLHLVSHLSNYCMSFGKMVLFLH